MSLTIARHQVTPEEVEELCHGDPLVQQGNKGRLLAVGPHSDWSDADVVIDPEGAGVYYPVTARSASRRERALHTVEKGGENQ